MSADEGKRTMTDEKTPDQWEASDIVEELKRDREEMGRRRKSPTPGTCPEHALLLESDEHDKTALIWIVRRLDLAGDRANGGGLSGRKLAAIITGVLSLIEGLRYFLTGGGGH